MEGTLDPDWVAAQLGEDGGNEPKPKGRGNARPKATGKKKGAAATGTKAPAADETPTGEDG
jgi:hypothetical protein